MLPGDAGSQNWNEHSTREGAIHELPYEEGGRSQGEFRVKLG
jgi:hypothetical protein